MNGNSLVVIENGQLSTYALDDKLLWKIGRPSKDNMPDIKIYSATVSRTHGELQNMDGLWFYIERSGKNGTVYNNKHIVAGLNGRVKPIMLKDGDILIFGGGEETSINHKTVWAMYTTKAFNERWRVIDTKDYSVISIMDGEKATRLENPEKGVVIEKTNGLAIYMGEVTYLAGDVSLVGR